MIDLLIYPCFPLASPNTKEHAGREGTGRGGGGEEEEGGLDLHKHSSMLVSNKTAARDSMELASMQQYTTNVHMGSLFAVHEHAGWCADNTLTSVMVQWCKSVTTQKISAGE